MVQSKMSDRDIKSWDQRLKDQVLLKWDNYLRCRIDLSIAHAGQFYGIAGEFFYVEEVSSRSVTAKIALNLNTNDQIDLKAGTTVKTVFKEVYLWNDAQAGEWIDIVIGINFEYYKQFGGYRKTNAILLDWTLLNHFLSANPTVETPELNVADDMQTILHIIMAHADTNDVTNDVINATLIKTGTADESWRELCRYHAELTTALDEALNAASGPAQANPDRIEVADTSGFVVSGKWIFLKDSTLGNSELCLIKRAEFNNYIECIHDLSLDHDAVGDTVYNVVDQWNVELPAAVKAAKVIFANNDEDATFAVQVRYSKVRDAD